ncbi:helicase-related protein [Polyangium spumosum]|nr:helicase-related protein [Polyangium spumosum]
MRDLAAPFLTEVRTLLRLPGANDRAVAKALLHRFDDDLYGTVQALRKRLGRLGLQKLRPDLVILDEFQRFFEILEPFRGTADDATQPPPPTEDEAPADTDEDEDANGLLRLLLDARGEEAGPAILLLSATPYRPPAGGIDGAGLGHYEQFFRLLEFLHGAQAKIEVPALRTLFRRYGTLLREASPGETEVLQLRDDIQDRLFRVIARTERAGLLGADARSTAPERRPVGLHADDVRIYRHLWASASEEDQSAVTPYWSSIPYPLQMMDQGYLLQKRARPAPLVASSERTLLLRARQVRRYEDLAPPHPRMRTLLDEVGGPLLGLPWLPPSLPWWPLDGRFREAADQASRTGGLSKVLLFSRFRAVPRAVASLLSYESERRVYAEARDRGRSYDYNARRRGGRDEEGTPEPDLEALPAPSFNWQSRQRETGERDLDHALLSLFIPAPRLGEIGDPQRIAGFARGDLRRSDAIEAVLAELQRCLAGQGSEVRVRQGGRPGQAWRALICLERRHEPTWPLFREALEGWADQTKNQVAKAVVRTWLREAQTAGALGREPISITENDLEELAELALVGPGVVLHRASKRVFGSACDARLRMRRSVDIALGALRTYLDEPEFHLTLAVRGRATLNHPDNVRKAIWHGNFEAVLDEYFAIHAGLGAQHIDPGRERKALDALEQALAIRVSSIQAKSLEGTDAPAFRLRCHAAMPFGLSPEKEERSDDDRPETRPDALRQAYNSPFRPFVLATTSIGQEGLDFHVYCDRLVHWDLPSSPVDLEQRDGRINRYGGLAIRKVLARPYAEHVAPIPVEGSPWLALSRSLPETCEGMAPWWGTEGAVIRRSVFLPPLARQEGELDRLLASLSHYRLALGQSDPEQLLRALHRRLEGAGTEEARAALHAWLREAQIDLAPVRRGPPPEEGPLS